MVHTVPTVALLGLDAYPVLVEVSIRRGTPMIQIVGLASAAVRDSRERIRAAVAQLGLRVPGLRITVNLAPAGVRKEGPAFDLPICAGILAASDQLPAERAARYALVGELGLDGRLRGIRGALPIALRCASQAELRGLIVPLDNLAETCPVTGFDVFGAGSLAEVLRFLRGTHTLPRPGGADSSARSRDGAVASTVSPDPDLADVKGQAAVKRALEVAAAGGHNVLLRGSPGSGKTMLARRVPTLLPPMTLQEAVQATIVHSVAGRLPAGVGLLERRPFRAPHHTVTEAGLIGGGALPRPGEVSLAHRGVLFLDELPEFRTRCLEAMRQPLEEGMVTVARARAVVRMPARFMLVAAMNPCPCGQLTDARDRCTCDPAAVRRYLSRLSGPLLDRIDMHVDVPRVPWRELRRGAPGSPSAPVRRRVTEARERARRRRGQLAEAGSALNAHLVVRDLREHCRLDGAGESLLERSADRLRLSARACHRILRVARTIADLAAREHVSAEHLAEAIRYRALDRQIDVFLTRGDAEGVDRVGAG